MGDYGVEWSERANFGMAEIRDDPLGFGNAQTWEYLAAIRRRCDALEFSPNRGTAVIVRGKRYRRFTHGGHVIWFRVIEPEKRVIIEAVLRRGREPGSVL